MARISSSSDAAKAGAESAVDAKKTAQTTPRRLGAVLMPSWILVTQICPALVSFPIDFYTPQK
jgi:hypothetical protein